MDAVVEVGVAVRLAARAVRRRFPATVLADLLSHGNRWVEAHPRRVEEMFGAGDMRGLQRAVAAELERFARREKAARAGYASEDEAFYSPALIEDILPSVCQPGLTPATAGREDRTVRAPSDPSVSAVWPVHVADVRDALDKSPMDFVMRGAVILSCGLLWPLERVADKFSLTVDEAGAVVARGLALMTAYLGGERPAWCNRSCRECHGKVLT